MAGSMALRRNIYLSVWLGVRAFSRAQGIALHTMAVKHLRDDIAELVVRRINDLGFSGMELSMKLLAEVGDARHEK